MKIEYNKGCTFQNIHFDNNTVFSQYDEYNPENKLTEEQIKKSRELALKLLNKLEKNELEYTYRMEISHNYEDELNKSIPEIKKELQQHINTQKLSTKDHTWFSFFELIKYFIESLGEELDSYDCEQCGDYNYSYHINI
jgi:outer membrane cobalamin receptor